MARDVRENGRDKRKKASDRKEMSGEIAANAGEIKGNPMTAMVFKNAIDCYNEILPKTRLSITERMQATNQMGQLFSANDRFLEKPDALVKIVRSA